MLSTLCLSNHPNQPHLIVAGCDNGSICFCDLRQEKVPISCIQAHSAEGENNPIYNVQHQCHSLMTKTLL